MLRASLSCKVPADTVVVPVYVLRAEEIILPAPVFVSPAAPPSTLSPSNADTVRSAVGSPVEPTLKVVTPVPFVPRLMKLFVFWPLNVSMKLPDVPCTVTVPLMANDPTVEAFPLVVVRRPPFWSVRLPIELNVVVPATRVIVPPSAMSVTGVA